jgi:hypothetical protein
VRTVTAARKDMQFVLITILAKASTRVHSLIYGSPLESQECEIAGIEQTKNEAL